jgi:DNA-binding transcriptional LysR family regulator
LTFTAVLNDDNNFAPHQLAQEIFLCRETGSDTQRLLDSFLKKLNIIPKHKIILGDTEAIKRGVINNMGVAFLSGYTFEYELQLGLLAPLKAASMKRPLLLLYQKGSRLSPAALAFLALLKKTSY